MKVDFKEKLFWNKKKFQTVDKLLEQEFELPLKTGEIHKYWARKKALLLEKYNMDWKTPAELNPGVKFD